MVVGLTAVLTTASLVAGILSWRAPKPLSSTLVNLNQRINAWWVMVVAITVAFFFGARRHDHPVRADLVCRLARIRDADAQPPQRPLGAARHVRHHHPVPVLAGVDRLVRPIHHLHPGLLLPADAGDHRASRRHRALSRARLGAAMGGHDLGLLRQPRAGAADARRARLRRPQPVADRFPDHHRARQRRAAIHLRQAVRQAPDVAEGFAVEDLGRAWSAGWRRRACLARCCRS